jgi:hypothetical protein
VGYEGSQPSAAFAWLRSALAVLIMGGSFALGLLAAVGGLLQLPDAVRRGDLLSALGVALLVTMWAALFAVGAGLWCRGRAWRPATAARWQRVFHLVCGIGVALMLLILAVAIVPRL